MSNIGLMEGAFFVGRKEVLDWLNSTLDLNLSKVEETASGCVACQLLDIMYPNQVPMNKLNWAAKQDFEFVANYKILQTCFTKLSIDRHIDVDRLISGKYMDNLEFMQWFKRFFEMAIPDKVVDYDCYGQRCKGKGGAQFNGGKKAGGSAKPASAASARPPSSEASGFKENSAPNMARQGSMAPNTNTSLNRQGSMVNKAAAASAKPSAMSRVASMANAPAADRGIARLSSTAAIGSTSRMSADTSANNAANEELQKSLDESRKQYSDLKQEMECLEKERDFYFEKLRDIEVMLQDIEDKGQGNDLTAQIFKVLYATAEGFEAVQVDDSPMSPSPMNGNGVARGFSRNDSDLAPESEAVETLVDETY